MEMNLRDLREDYGKDSIDVSTAAADPYDQFEDWLRQALMADVPEPNAMTLATATPDGRPSARIVLLKGMDPRGLVFYTNYESRKGRELAANPYASLVFLWLPLHRQVRVDGVVEKVSAEESLEYFQSRPRGSQIGAWASPQSRAIESREALEQKVEELKHAYKDLNKLPRPEHWGGYRVKAERFEFWQGRPDRLHDRIQYELQPDDSWKITRLAP